MRYQLSPTNSLTAQAACSSSQSIAAIVPIGSGLAQLKCDSTMVMRASDPQCYTLALTLPKPLMILVAGPYRSGTNDDPALIRANVAAMTEVALRLFRIGHLPVLGEWFVLPLIEHAAFRKIGDAIFDEIFHPISRELAVLCDACLRIGGPSKGADEMVDLARTNGRTVYMAIDDVPAGPKR